MDWRAWLTVGVLGLGLVLLGQLADLFVCHVFKTDEARSICHTLTEDVQEVGHFVVDHSAAEDGGL